MSFNIIFYKQNLFYLNCSKDFIKIPVNTSDEPRFPVIGKISGKHWSGIITYRSEHARIISVRQSIIKIWLAERLEKVS